MSENYEDAYIQLELDLEDLASKVKANDRNTKVIMLALTGFGMMVVAQGRALMNLMKAVNAIGAGINTALHVDPMEAMRQHGMEPYIPQEEEEDEARTVPGVVLPTGEGGGYDPGPSELPEDIRAALEHEDIAAFNPHGEKPDR